MGTVLQFKRNEMAERRESLIGRWVSFQERVTLALVTGMMTDPLCMLFEQELELLEAELGLLQQDMEGRRVQ